MSTLFSPSYVFSLFKWIALLVLVCWNSNGTLFFVRVTLIYVIEKKNSKLGRVFAIQYRWFYP